MADAHELLDEVIDLQLVLMKNLMDKIAWNEEHEVRMAELCDKLYNTTELPSMRAPQDNRSTKRFRPQGG